jgi:hypothetical protein
MMRRFGQIGLAAAAVGVLAVGGHAWLQHRAEAEARAYIDARLSAMGLAETLRYGGVNVGLLSRDVAVSDLVLSEGGTEVWRIDRVEIKDIKTTPKGLPVALAVAVRGLNLDFARWEHDCTVGGVSCEYAESAGELRSQGIDQMRVDADFAYDLDDAAKRLRVSAGLTMRQFFSVGAAFSLGGLDSGTLRAIVDWAQEATQSGVPPVLAAAAFGATVGKSIERVDLGGIGFSMTDRGALLRRAEFLAKERGDRRPPADILNEQRAEMAAEIRADAKPWMDPAFVEAMVVALDPFVASGKPYRIVSGEAAPVVLLKRGAQGLEAGPDLADPARLFRALAPKVDNLPL